MPSPIETLLRVHDSPRADPDILGIFRIDRDGADRLHWLFVEDRTKAGAAVIRFPNAAAGCADEKRNLARRLLHAGDGGNAAAHRGRPDIARAQSGNCGGIVRRFVRSRKLTR